MITFKQWFDFITHFDFKAELRLGQAFCNKFEIKDNILFYMTNRSDTINYIYKTYINLEDHYEII